ncbi:hypothetical protein ASD81_13085 [Nocardioides sp. Root614]|nr:hypothetical protein ASD81_13085 [Nocardioides sp. Root614]KRA89142.1 hypothetical protein ASD84_13350 [Nocardioides sp. Root682]
MGGDFAVTQLSNYPGTWISIFTLGIARASWISSTNKTLGRGGAGFLFAWFFMAFAQYGVTGRLNEALAAAGSAHRESPILVFLLTGFPFIGSKKRLRRATSFYNDAQAVRSTGAPAPA